MPHIIQNKLIPFGRYKAINLFGLIFTKTKLNDIDITHESIHTVQMKELLYLGFYIIYCLEWLFKVCKYRNTTKAYKNVSFEKEAYTNEKNKDYLSIRKHYQQWRHERLFN